MPLKNKVIPMKVLQIFFLAFALFLQGNLAKSRYGAGKLYQMKSGDSSLQETSKKVVEQTDAKLVCDCVAHIYEHPNYKGRNLTILQQNANFANDYFNNRADSIKIVGKCPYILYEHCNFRGRYYIVNQGNYSSVSMWGGPTDRISSARALPLRGTNAIVLFEHCNYQGRMLVLKASDPRLSRNDFNNRASSIIVIGGTWNIHNYSNFQGTPVTIRGESKYPNLRQRFRLGDAISSVELIRSSRFQTIEEVTNEELDDDEDWSSEY